MSDFIPDYERPYVIKMLAYILLQAVKGITVDCAIQQYTKQNSGNHLEEDAIRTVSNLINSTRESFTYDEVVPLLLQNIALFDYVSRA